MESGEKVTLNILKKFNLIDDIDASTEKEIKQSLKNEKNNKKELYEYVKSSFS